MSEDWEDDFEVPDLSAKLNIANDSKKTFDDEDETTVEKPTVASKATKTAIPKDTLAIQKAKEEEAKLSAKLKIAQMENLTADQRKLKEREMVEESDVKLAGELFGTNKSNDEDNDAAVGLGGIPVRTKQDHVNFAILCDAKLEQSTSFNVVAYYKEITDRLKDRLTLEGLNDIIKVLTVVRDEKKKTAAVNDKPAKKSAKAMKKEMKEINDKFGGVEEDEYEARYGSVEDDFM